METEALIKEIQQLPVSQRMYLAERIIHSIREQSERTQLEEATELLLEDYKSDSELTIFTSIDLDDFYETR